MMKETKEEKRLWDEQEKAFERLKKHFEQNPNEKPIDSQSDLMAVLKRLKDK